jgi:hypothetical protein
MIGSVFGSPGMTLLGGDDAGADDELGGGVGLGVGVGVGDGVGLGDGDGGAVR